MARVLVTSSKWSGRIDGQCWAEILADENGYTWARTTCGETVSDRGHFEDTVRAAEVHVDQCERPPA